MDIDRLKEKLMRAFDKVVNAEALAEGLEPDDVAFAKNLADRVNTGDVTSAEADQLLKDWSKTKGYDVPDDDEFSLKDMLDGIDADVEKFQEVVEKGDFIDITEKVQMALREAGEPGIADALLELWVNPGPIPVDPAERNKVAVGMKAKAWFNLDAMNELEHERFTTACVLSAREVGVDWPFPNV